MPPKYLSGLERDSNASNTPQPGLDDDFLNQLILGMLGGQGGIGGSSFGSTVVVPPVVDILGEMRLRREAEAGIGKTMAEILNSNLPGGLSFYPGMEPGGLADVLLGIITGKGPGAAAGILPYDQRRVERMNIPFPTEGMPSVGEEFSEASALANAILNAIRTVPTSGSTSDAVPLPQLGGTGTSTSVPQTPASSAIQQFASSVLGLFGGG